MNFQSIMAVGLLVALAWIMLELAERWYIRRLISGVLRNAEGRRETARLVPESLYIVQLSDDGVRCIRPNGNVESVAWNELMRVEIVTTDDGPFLPDIFWLLHGSRGGYVVPQGATNENQLLERLQELPGFRNDAAINAMSSADNRRFVCWEKSGASS